MSRYQFSGLDSMRPLEPAELVRIAEHQRCGRRGLGWVSDLYCSRIDIAYLVTNVDAIETILNKKTDEGNYRTDVIYKNPETGFEYIFFTITEKPLETSKSPERRLELVEA